MIKKISELFTLYEQHINSTPDVELIFSESEKENIFGVLDYGFFPLGSGILSDEKSLKDRAAIKSGNIMILGNDFGTKSYFDKLKDKRESKNNPTIRNLLKTLEVNTTDTFFTNLYLGLRTKGGNATPNPKRAEEYKKFCFAFLKIQLDFINPTIVICLGKSVGDAISEITNKEIQFKKSIVKLYADDRDREYVKEVDHSILGKRKFVLIPHPCWAHKNWKSNDIVKKIKKELAN